MNIRSFLINGLLLCVFSSAPLLAAKMHTSNKTASFPEGPRIKVLLTKDTNSVLVEAKGKYCVVRKDTGDILSQGSVGKRFVMHALQDGLRWGEEYPDVYQILLLPQSPETVFYVNGIQYKGSLAAYHVRDNRISIVNEVAIEEYIKSILAIRLEEDVSQEAMAAMAIAARTEAYARVVGGKGSLRPWDVIAEDVSYYGFGITCQQNKTDEAVDLTRFMVMESTKQPGPLQNPNLDPTKADELANAGYDAQKILKTSFPHIKMGVTVNPDELALLR